MSSNSEDEEVGDLDQIDLFHVQREKSTLARYGTTEEHSSSDGDGGEDEEVMPLALSSSEADLSSTDQLIDERDLSLKAWGRKVAAYYKEGDEGEEESLDDELEEREALQLQTVQASLLSQSDFGVQFLGGGAMEQFQLSDEDNMVVPVDLANVDAAEKDLLVSRDHAELPHIIAGLKTALGCAVNDATLLGGSFSHMETYLQVSVLLNLSYSLNSMYCLLLKADRVSVASHPVSSTLLLLHKLLGRLERVHKVAEKQGSRASDTQWKHQPHIPTSGGDKADTDERKEDPLSFYHEVATQKKEAKSTINMVFQENLQPLKGKRAITYQISRNKGLGLSGKRQVRNPRVKHRRKYKKALMKRKSQILPVVREMTKYAGESTGIKADLSRSTVIAS